MALPASLLDTDELAAVAVGLRLASADPGLAPAATTALAKLRGTAPSRSRPRLEALLGLAVPVNTTSRAPATDVLLALAHACRSGHAIAVRYRSHGPRPPLTLQPLGVVLLQGTWYLVACPSPQLEWSIYRIDQLSRVQPLGRPRPAPAAPADLIAFAVTALSHGSRRHDVVLRLHTSADVVRERVPRTTATLVHEGEHHCVITLTTNDLDWAARWIVHLDLDIDVLAPSALSDRLAALGNYLGERYRGRPAES